MDLRPYQREALDAVLDEWTRVRSTLLVLPTGTGKTICFAEIARRVSGRVLVLAHTEELIWQACHKIKAVTGEDPDIEMADYKAHLSIFQKRIVVGTIQTHARRMGKYDPAWFSAVVFDEGHHAVSDSWRKVMAHYMAHPGVRFLGVTATPDRTDGLGLKGVFDTCAYTLSLQDAIGDGWLVPVVQQPIEVSGLDWSKVRVTAGELNAADVADAMLTEEVPQEVASVIVREIGTRKALVFVPTVAVAQMVADIINRHRPGMAGVVSGTTPKDERKAILDDFSAKRLQVLVNCMVLTEGFDDPGVEVVVLARPTKSRSLFAQMIGRGTRALPGVVDGPPDASGRRAAILASAKPSVEILDLRGNCGRHKLVNAADILGGDDLPPLEQDEVNGLADAIMKKKGRGISVMDAIAQARQEIADKKAEAAKRRKEEEARRREESARFRKLKAEARYEKGQVIDPFDIYRPDDDSPNTESWARPLTPKQRAVLVKQGVPVEGMTAAQERRTFNEIIRRWDNNLCSWKQAKLLNKHGYDGKNATRQEASKIIDAIARDRGWSQQPREQVANLDGEGY